MITDAEFTFWIIAGIVSLIAAVVLWVKAKRDSANYIDWIAEGDWK